MTRRGPLKAPSSTRRVVDRHPSPKALIQLKPSTRRGPVKLRGSVADRTLRQGFEPAAGCRMAATRVARWQHGFLLSRGGQTTDRRIMGCEGFHF